MMAWNFHRTEILDTYEFNEFPTQQIANICKYDFVMVLIELFLQLFFKG